MPYTYKFLFIGRFFLGQFVDDKQCSRLRTMMSLYPPIEILIERKCISKELSFVLKNYLPSTVAANIRYLRKDKEFVSSLKSLQMIREGKYFEDHKTKKVVYPEILTMMTDCLDTPKPEYELAIRSLGAVVFYLQQCLIDEELLTLKLFEEYCPADLQVSSPRAKDNPLPSHMILDSSSLENLNILSSEEGYKGSLLSLLNFCRTKFGVRLLRYWICAPLTSIDAINARLDAIEDLKKLGSGGDKFEILDKFLSSLPDLEKMLNFIHTEGLRRKKDHPDSRAQMFENYDKKKISTLIDVVTAFTSIADCIENMRSSVGGFKSNLLKAILTPIARGGRFPDIIGLIAAFEKSFDIDQAKTTGQIIPGAGVVSEFDDINDAISRVEEELDAIRREECRKFGTNVTLKKDGKKGHLLEIPINRLPSNITSEYKFESQTKTVKRFSTQKISNLNRQLKELDEQKASILSDIKRRIFEKFAKDFHTWMAGVQCIATLDCLLSLTKATRSMAGPVCRPTLIPITASSDPLIDVTEGKHPILAKFMADKHQCYVSNSAKLGGKLTLLTGPNMGGKSTLMRQTGLLVILAQMGCFVPAASMTLTPVDRIFTRLGAMDRIMEGESTFFVELSETASLLKHSTRNSLILLDELGRGTSTFDGTAIAYSVVKKLSSSVKCPTLFSTHYHSLVESFSHDDKVTSAHMGCEERGGKLVFLYRVQKGACPKSHGFNAARLAGLPDPLVREAEKVAEGMEEKSRKCGLLRRLIGDGQDKRAILRELQNLTI